MILMQWPIRVVVCLLLLSLPAFGQTIAASSAAASQARPLELRIAVLSDGHAAYFTRLLEASLRLIDQP